MTSCEGAEVITNPPTWDCCYCNRSRQEDLFFSPPGCMHSLPLSLSQLIPYYFSCSFSLYSHICINVGLSDGWIIWFSCFKKSKQCRFKSEFVASLMSFWMGGRKKKHLSQEISCQQRAWSCLRTVPLRGSARKKGRKRMREKEMSALVVTFHWQRKLPLWHVVDKCQCPVNSLQINCLSSYRRAARPRAAAAAHWYSW